MFDLIPETNHYTKFVRQKMLLIHYSKTAVYKYPFFPYKLLEWNKHDRNKQQSKTIPSYRNSLLKIGRPTAKPSYNIPNPTGLKLLTRLRLRISHLHEHKFIAMSETM